MPLSNAGKNAIKAYGQKRFSFNSQPTEPTGSVFQDPIQSGEMNAPTGPAPFSPRKKLLQTINPEPVRDEKEEERLKSLAKVNALGRALGSLGQLAGVASGGDAVGINDTVSPFVTDKLAYLDNDYRNQLQDHFRRSFIIDQFNVEQENRDIADQNDYRAQIDRINMQGAKEKEVLDYRAELEMKKFNAMTAEEKAQAMMNVGINPNSQDATQRFLKVMQDQFGVDSNYKKSQTAENYANANRMNNPTSDSGESYDLETLQSGVKNIVSGIQSERNQVLNNPELRPAEKEQMLKNLDDQLKFWTQTYNPKNNQLLNRQVMDAASGNQTDPKQAEGVGHPYTPGKGFNAPQNQKQPAQERSEEEVIKALNQNRSNVIKNAKVISSMDLNNPDEKTAQMVLGYAQELVDLGVTEDLESALETVINLASQNAN